MVVSRLSWWCQTVLVVSRLSWWCHDCDCLGGVTNASVISQLFWVVSWLPCWCQNCNGCVTTACLGGVTTVLVVSRMPRWCQYWGGGSVTTALLVSKLPWLCHNCMCWRCHDVHVDVTNSSVMSWLFWVLSRRFGGVVIVLAILWLFW